MGNVVIVILGLCLVLLTFSYIRQRIEDRENELLNQQAHKVYKKVGRKIVIADRNDEMPDLYDIAPIWNFIGHIEEYDKTPKNGDFGIYNGYNYVFCDGKWNLVTPTLYNFY